MTKSQIRSKPMPTISQRNNGELLAERRENLHHRKDVRASRPALKTRNHRLRHAAQFLKLFLRDAALLPRTNQLPDQRHTQITLGNLLGGKKSLSNIFPTLSNGRTILHDKRPFLVSLQVPFSLSQFYASVFSVSFS